MDIKLVALDIDGVLTDGRLQYGPDGEETKTFHVKDGAAIKRLMRAGVDVCWITARGSDAVACRAKELGVQKLYMKVSNKLEVLEKVVEELGINFSEVCYVGDDTIDMECMSRVGLAVAPADAIQKVREIADFCTDAKGGHGVVAEVGDTLLTSDASDDGFYVVIPARFGASRLAGKPLLDLAGKTMIQWVYQKATGSRARSVVVATDHEGIRDSAEEAGARVVMTDSELPSGTDRVAAVCEAMELKDTDIVVNLQGDEPLMPSEAIDLVAQDLISHKEAHISTLAVPLKDDEYTNPNAVKVVTDHGGYGLYFSRAPIPAVRGDDGGQPSSFGKRHLGIYAYRVGALKAITKANPAELEKLESLEQLRALAMGLKIHVATWEGYVPHGIDSEDDIARVVAELKAAKTRGKQ